MSKLFSRFNWYFLICPLLLFGFGGVMIGSVAPPLLLSQLFFYLLGLGLFFLFSQIDYHLYQPFEKIIYIFALVALLITFFIGFESRGAIRWIPLGPFRLQFSEILKPFLIAAFASYLSRQTIRTSIKNLILSLLWMAIPLVLIFRQPDLGSSLVYAGAFFVVLFVSGLNFLYILLGTVLSAISAPLIWHFLADFQKARILNFLSPGFDPQGGSYNAIQSLITVGSGMFFGKGLGRGTQTQLSFLPEHHTDFIFASLSEELGFIGGLTVLIIYFVLIFQIFSLSSKTTDPFSRFLSVGLGTIFLVQIFINIGMNIGLLPITGITLPLISYGGSSILSSMIALGIIENIARSHHEDRLILS